VEVFYIVRAIHEPGCDRFTDLDLELFFAAYADLFRCRLLFFPDRGAGCPSSGERGKVSSLPGFSSQLPKRPVAGMFRFPVNLFVQLHQACLYKAVVLMNQLSSGVI